MFGYFTDPFYDPFVEYRPIRVYHPFNAMNRYFNNLERRLNSLFADAFDEEFNNMIEQDKPKEQKEEKPKEEELKKFVNKLMMEKRLIFLNFKRIGNRWVQVDEVVDKEGKKTTKETWHNVGEDEIDAFENEWSLRRGIETIGSKNEEKPAIKSENTEKKEEPKEETKEEPKETKEQQ
ncbi:cysteine protease [Histomonas meleagridis]|nr:cysteine protease [Histomonas meleagridis]